MARSKRSEKTYTTKELLTELESRGRKMSPQRLHQLRRGFVQIKNGVKYPIAAKLRQGQDWWFEDGVIHFGQTSVDKILDDS